MQLLKKARLEFHDNAKNSHKFYEVRLEQDGPDAFRVKAEWGRCGGFGGSGHRESQVKDIVGDVISALVVFQDWICAKEKRGYKQATAVQV